MDKFDEAPEVQVPVPGPSAQRQSQPEDAATEPVMMTPPSPPLIHPPVMEVAGKKSGNPYAWVYWTLGIGFGVFILAAIFGSGGSKSSSTAGSYGGSGSSGGGSAPAPAAAPLDFRPVCKALDEKNGFKDFRFGMTPSEARAVVEPTRVTQSPGASEEMFVYSGTPVNRIGEFPADSVSLQFFEGRLYRVNIRFASFASEIFEALKINYGEPFEGAGWKRGTEALQAECWQGEKIFAAIVGPMAGAWDAVVMYDEASNQRAREYAEKEPERAAQSFSTNGFGTLAMGMRLRDLVQPHVVQGDDPVTKVKKVALNGDDLPAIGFYPLTSVSCEFFDDRLFRIDLAFRENRKEIFETVQHRFGPLQANSTWTRGTEKLTAKSGGGEPLYCSILAPGGSYGGEEWDLIVLLDYSIQKEAEEFKSSRAKSAARDFSTNGFKSLAMGMRLQDLDVQYTVSENNEVTGVKKILIRSGGVLSVGIYPLRYVSCEFFKDRLYRIDLEFNQNRKEIFQAFQHRFEPLQVNDSWTQGSTKLTARSGGGDRCYGTILAPGGTYGGEEWETVVLLDGVLQREAAQFKQDAPKRAARDL